MHLTTGGKIVTICLNRKLTYLSGADGGVLEQDGSSRTSCSTIVILITQFFDQTANKHGLKRVENKVRLLEGKGDGAIFAFGAKISSVRHLFVIIVEKAN